jgi:acyl-CoA dehydrogenase
MSTAEALAPLRGEVREFLAEQAELKAFVPHCDSWLSGWDPEFSASLGARGWVGMTMPPQFGGQGRSYLERQIVIEELLAAGAPVAAHWMADRQIGPALLRCGTDAQRQHYLPLICSGRFYFSVGLSEPDAGSDLASIRTRASRVRDGWLLRGAKVWTSGAHRSHAIVVLARTSPSGGDRHSGMSQFIVPTGAAGVTISPIRLLTNEHHFNEVRFDDVFVSDESVLGEVGSGWDQVMAELANERSGPERFLSTLPALEAARSTAQLTTGHGGTPISLGFSLSRLWALREASFQVAATLAAEKVPTVEAAIVKDAGTRFEVAMINVARELRTQASAKTSRTEDPDRLLEEAILHSPGYTLRGGTNEVLRTVVARSLVES